MTYSMQDKNVYWKNRRIKLADQASFIELSSVGFAKDSHRVFYVGKPINVDVGSFEVLGEGYARDIDNVYEILATKLKLIKHADSKTFIALSAYYAKDCNQAYFRGKRIVKCDLLSFRALHPVFAIDEKRVYFTNSPFSPIKGEFDYRHAQVRVKESYDEINCPSVVINDGENVYISSWRYGKKWQPITHADPSSFEFFAESNDYQCDKQYLYYQGQVIEGVDPRKARLVGPHVIKDGTALWCMRTRIDQPFRALRKESAQSDAAFFEGSISHRVIYIEEYYRDDHGVWEINYSGYSENDQLPNIQLLQTAQPLPSDIDQQLFEVYKLIFASLGAVLRQMPLALDFQSLPPSMDDIPIFSLHRNGREVEVIVDEQCISAGQISSWFSHACVFWSHLYKRRDALTIYPRVGVMGPDADVLHKMIVALMPDKIAGLASVLYSQGEEEEAIILTRLILNCRLNKEQRTTILAIIPIELLQKTDYRKLSYDFSQTTNLAVAKHVIQSGLIADDRFLVRYEMLNFIYARMVDTTNPKTFFINIIPDIVKRVDDEPIGFLRELVVGIIEMALVKAFVSSEVNNQHFYDLVEPFIRSQIHHRVNIDLNRARLVEALWAQEKNSEAEIERNALLKDCDDEWLAPPMYAHRIYWRNYRLWLMAAKIRVAWREPMNKVTINARLAQLSLELQDMYDYFGRPGNWDDFFPSKMKGSLAQFRPKEEWDDFKILRRDIEILRNYSC